MNILYGIQGTGNGHLSRSREVIRHLKQAGHNVRVILSGRPVEAFPEMPDLQPYDVFRGMTFVTEAGKIRTFKTALQLRIRRLFRDVRRYDASGLDLVITDYEPVSARIARRHGIPCIGIAHQYAFFYDVPRDPGTIVSRWVLRAFAPVERAIGLHYHHFGQPILPPILTQAFPEGHDVVPNKVLVYFPFEDPDEVLELLRPFSRYEFFIYAKTDRPVDHGHLHQRPFSREGFLADMVECSGIMANAGFMLSSEALHLGKRLLVRPVAGQLEQLSNAVALESMDRAYVMHGLEKNIVEAWLTSAPAEPMNYPAVASQLAAWIGRGNWDDLLRGLAESVWQQGLDIGDQTSETVVTETVD
ncbi:MAG: glycosyltransferase family protein [Planctomycetota bacterium]